MAKRDKTEALLAELADALNLRTTAVTYGTHHHIYPTKNTYAPASER